MKATMKALVCTLGVAAMGLTNPAAAQDARTIGEIYKECGLGAIIFTGDTENSQIIAAISNITSDLGSTAITSGLVSPATCTGGSVETAAFIMHTYPSLERDLARGEGEYINAMLELRDCDVTSHHNIIEDMRANYADELVGDTAIERASSLFDSFENTLATSYSDSCVV